MAKAENTTRGQPGGRGVARAAGVKPRSEQETCVYCPAPATFYTRHGASCGLHKLRLLRSAR